MYPLIKGMLLALATTSLIACSSTTPEDALNEAAKQLQNSLEDKQASAVVKQLHDDFQAQQRYDKQAVHQQMLGLFLRYRNVNIIVLNRQCQLDRGFNYRGQCTAQVTVTGAQGLIPERLDYYQVSSQWELSGDDWLLHSLDWQ